LHPCAVDAYFAHGKVTNWFGGSSNATTHLLDEMHHRGLLRLGSDSIVQFQVAVSLQSRQQVPQQWLQSLPADPI
jgi:hypothetical protein